MRRSNRESRKTISCDFLLTREDLVCWAILVAMGLGLTGIDVMFKARNACDGPWPFLSFCAILAVFGCSSFFHRRFWK